MDFIFKILLRFNQEIKRENFGKSESNLKNKFYIITEWNNNAVWATSV